MDRWESVGPGAGVSPETRTRALGLLATGRPTVLVAMHSFTPVYKGVARPWHAGVLFNRDDRFASPTALVKELKRAAKYQGLTDI